ncbi:CDP-alcohol phosphatidyltransferase family protein [soil metagenome]
MLDRVLRGPKDRMMAPLASGVGAKLHPNTISLGAFAVGMACAALLASGEFAGGLVLWVVNRLLDGLDGLVARRQGLQSDLGGYLDIIFDLVVYALIPIALAIGAPDQPGLWLALPFLLASFYVNAGSWMFLSAILEKRGRELAGGSEDTSVTFPPGVVEGTETMILFTLFIIFPGQLAHLFWVAAVLVALTAVQRLVWASTNLRNDLP